MRRALTTALTSAWAVSRRASVRAFDEASRDPSRAQEAWLRRALPSLGSSRYGRTLGLDTVTSLDDFRRRAPLTTWEEVAPHVELLANGTHDALTTEPVLMLERTSGSTALPKRVPYTQGLLDDFGAATGPWLDDLFHSFPQLSHSRQYWSLSPASREQETTPSGLPIGFDDDTAYFGPVTRLAMKQVMAVPSSLGRLRSLEVWRDETLTHLLACEDLGFFSIWSPSFLTLLLDALPARWPALKHRFGTRRRALIEAALGPFDASRLWPQLSLISCWTSGWAAEALPALRRYFPTTPIQGKGLLATEGVVSFPLWGQPSPVAAVTSHLLEFVALEDEGAPVRLVTELAAGASYQPVLTTRGGLVRYRLPDVVRCVGHFRHVPMLDFVGRLDRTSDLRGEKLSAVVVEAALRAVLRGTDVEFALLAPSLATEPPRYVLFAEGATDQLTADLERRLLEQHHYRYCRELGQLGAVQLIHVHEGQRRWHDAMRARGLKVGDIKPSGFDPLPGWEAVFSPAVERSTPR